VPQARFLAWVLWLQLFGMTANKFAMKEGFYVACMA
jgi:hypothetical protein